MTVDQLFQAGQFGRGCARFDPHATTDRLIAGAHVRVNAEEAAQINLTGEFNGHAFEVNAERRGVRFIRNFLAGAECRENEFDGVRSGVAAAELRRFVDDEVMLPQGNVGAKTVAQFGLRVELRLPSGRRQAEMVLRVRDCCA